MTKKKLQPFFFMVYTPSPDDVMGVDIQQVNAYDFDDAVELMKDVGTLMEPDHLSTSFPRILAHETRTRH